jgi:hypothetical protein
MWRRSRAAVLAVAAVILAAGFVYVATNSDTGRPALSLVDDYPKVVKRSAFPELEAFSVYDATIGNETRRVVYSRPPSRITWRITLPRNAQLQAWLALRDDSWRQLGNGVVFRIGVSDGRSYQELLSRHVDPYGSPEDRRWIPVAIDLSPFAQKTVDLIFNTDPSLPGMPPDGRNDLALWGEPTVAAAR